MAARRIDVRAGLLALGLCCAACDDPCAELADQLRECCARGPAELRQSCEAEAEALQDDGNTDACEDALERRLFAECQP